MAPYLQQFSADKFVLNLVLNFSFKSPIFDAELLSIFLCKLGADLMYNILENLYIETLKTFMFCNICVLGFIDT